MHCLAMTTTAIVKVSLQHHVICSRLRKATAEPGAQVDLAVTEGHTYTHTDVCTTPHTAQTSHIHHKPHMHTHTLYTHSHIPHTHHARYTCRHTLHTRHTHITQNTHHIHYTHHTSHKPHTHIPLPVTDLQDQKNDDDKNEADQSVCEVLIRLLSHFRSRQYFYRTIRLMFHIKIHS